MSISQKMEELRPYIDLDGITVFEELQAVATPYEPDFQLDSLVAMLKDDAHDDAIHAALDQLEISTARYTKISPDRRNSFKTDLLRYFTYCHRFVDEDMRDVLSEYVGLYHKIFGEPKKMCGSTNLSCTVPGCSGRFDDWEQVFCPECGSHRTLCKNGASSNGRCRRAINHGGITSTGALNDNTKRFGRVQLYEQSLNGHLKDMYVEAVTDPNYLSVAPEMGALAARSAELMSNIGDTDYIAVAASAQQSIRKMRKALTEDKPLDIMEQAIELEGLLTGVADDKRRWDEIAALSGRMGRLVEVERKRLVEEQKMITVQEMYLLQQETLAHIRDTAGAVAAQVVRMVRNDSNVTVRGVRQIFLKTLHGVMKGDVDVNYYLEEVKDPVIIDAE